MVILKSFPPREACVCVATVLYMPPNTCRMVRVRVDIPRLKTSTWLGEEIYSQYPFAEK